jgi:hypothetical protein
VTKLARVPRIGVATRTSSPEALVDADLDTLVTALYVKIECATKLCWPGWRWETVHRPAVVAAGWSWRQPNPGVAGEGRSSLDKVASYRSSAQAGDSLAVAGAAAVHCAMGVQVGFHGGSSRFRWPSSLVLAPEGPRTSNCPRRQAAFLHVREHTARPSAGGQYRHRSLWSNVGIRGRSPTDMNPPRSSPAGGVGATHATQ